MTIFMVVSMVMVRIISYDVGYDDDNGYGYDYGYGCGYDYEYIY